MGTDGTGTLGVSLWTGSPDVAQTFTLDLSRVSGSSYAIQGNLDIEGGQGANNTFNAIFGGTGVSGSITIRSVGKTNLTFNDGATFKNGLSASNGINNITFNDVGSISSIDTTGGNNTFVFENNVTTDRIWGKNGVNSFTFNGNATISSGSEVIYGGFYQGSYHGQNTYVFKGTDNTIKNTNGSTGIAIHSNGNNGSSTLNTFHHLTFENETGTNTIIGKINSVTDSNRGDKSAKNTIIFSGIGATNTITGDITADNYGQNHLTFRGATNTITGNIRTGWGGTTAISFEGSGTQTSQITGGISTYRNSTTISFEGQKSATITGGSISSDRTLEDGGNFITFSNNGNASINIEGYNISSEGAQNVILFENNTTQTITANEISASTRWSNYPNNINTITFIGQERSESTITANITASDGVNNISFQGSGTQSIVGNMNTSSTYGVDTRNVISFSGETASITGNITSTNGSNSITFSGENSTNTITGNISATSGRNSITFSAELSNNTITGNISGANTIVSNGLENTIIGDIFNETNTITFSNTNSTNIITGKISGTNNITLLGESNTLGGELRVPADPSDPVPYSISTNGGRNNIIATNLTFKNVGTITAGPNGNEAKNLFDISGDTKIIGSDLVITTYNRDNTNTYKYNIFKFGGNIFNEAGESQSIVIAGLDALSCDGGQDRLSRTKNVLSFDNLSSPTTLTITDINKSTSIPSGKRTGYNYIGKNLTSGSGSSLDFNSEFTDSTWNADEYQATNLTLIVTNINMSKGGNYISVGTLETENITNDGGQNNILADTFSNTSKIDSGWGGTTNIYVKRSLNISGSITAGAYNGNANGGNAGVNNIHLIGDNATGTISGNIGIGTNGNENIQNNFYLSGANTTLTTTGTISFNGSGNGQNNITLSGDNATFILQGASNSITTLAGYVAPSESRATGYSTLNLDGEHSTSGVNASISNAVTTGAVAINFNGATSKATHLTLSSGGNTLYGITLGSQTNTSSTDNTLTLSQGATTITTTTSVASGQALTFDFANGADVNLTNNISNAGTTNINFNGTNGILTGAISTTANTTTINVADGKSGTITGNIATDGGATNVVFAGGAGGTLSLQGSNITLSSVDATNATTGTNTVVFGGNSNDVVANITGALAPANAVTLQLTSSTDVASATNTRLNLSNSISNNVSVVFENGVDDQLHFSTLALSGEDKTLASVTSNAKNAKILMSGTTNATITTATISNGSSLIFAFTGDSTSQASITNAMTVESGATLGISLGGSGAKTIDGTITFAEGSTLLVDFLDGNSATGTISGANTTIEANRNSIINFHGTNTGSLGGDITLDGGNNTVNFIGTAKMGGVVLTSGTNTFNVYGADSEDTAITGTIDASKANLGAITNTINLADYATFKVGDDGLSSLTSTGTNTINFKGINTKLQGGLAVSGGTTTIKIGDATKGANGLISGSIATGSGTTSVVFADATEAKKLTLGGASNKISSIGLGANSIDADGVILNTLELIGGAVSTPNTTTIDNAVSIASDNGLNLDFNGVDTKLTLTGNLSNEGNAKINFRQGIGTVNGAITTSGTGTTNINVIDGANGVIVGAVSAGGTSLVADIGNASSLAFSGGLTTSAGDTEINFIGATGTLEGSVSTTTGNTTFNLGLSDGSLASVTATIDGTITNSDTNNFNVYATSTALKSGAEGLAFSGGTNNIIFAKDGATLNWQNNNGETKTISTSGGTTNINFNKNGTLAGGINTSGGSTTINVGDDTNGAIAIITETIRTAEATGATNIVFKGGNEAKTLKLRGSQNEVTSVDATNAGTLILDTTNNAVITAIDKAITGSDLAVQLNGVAGDTPKEAMLVLSNTTNSGSTSSTIASLDLGSNSASNGTAYNTLEVAGGTTTITALNGLDTANKGINFDFNGTAELALTELTNSAGVATLNFKRETGTFNGSIYTTDTGVTSINVIDGANGVITGNIEGDGTTSVTFGAENNRGGNTRFSRSAVAPTTLTLQGARNTITNIDATNAGTLILDTTKKKVTATISNEIVGDNLTAQFNGAPNKASTLNLNGGKLAIEINSGAIDENILNLQSGTTTVIGGISIETGEGITVSLAENANLTSDLTNNENLDLNFLKNNILTGDINTTAGTTNINVKTGANGIITGEIKGRGATQATLEANSTLNLVSNATLSKVAMDSTSTLDLSNAVGTHSEKNTSYSFDELDAGGANVVLYSEANKAKVRVSAGGTQTSDKYFTLLKIGSSGNGLVGNDTTFTLHLDNAKYDNVYLGGVKQDGTTDERANLYGHAYSDRIIIENGSKDGGVDKLSSINLKVVPILKNVGNISYTNGGTEVANNVAVLTIKNDAIDSTVEADQFVGVAGLNTQVTLVSTTTDIAGKAEEGGAYTTYFVGSATIPSISEGVKEIASTALTVNYDLFLANFNSLNKRMGELRDNAHNQGVWARVYGGAMSNDFGAGSKTEYVTAQGGYDYSISLDNARNYMGIAIAYGHSSTKSNQIQNAVTNVGVGQATGLQDVNSNMVEVGIYNSYVMDSGWYNDTILKFDYIMSSFTMTDNPSLESETNNFAMILSNEFGYRYKFGSDASWYIDPQLEVGFGYFNQSDFNRVIFDHINQQSADIKATQDTILTLRGRAGLSLGKKFTTDKGFASLYVGAFYEYDYIEGGNANASSFGVVNTIDSIESNGRAVVNVGSNIELTDGVRMYIDVEKSFGDKQRTDMQFNFGARYSFGEATPTLSHHEQYKAISAPLKVDGLKDHKDDEESKNDTEESKNTEKEDSKSK